jgi:hypothetical protein
VRDYRSSRENSPSPTSLGRARRTDYSSPVGTFTRRTHLPRTSHPLPSFLLAPSKKGRSPSGSAAFAGDSVFSVRLFDKAGNIRVD